jgi:predicted SAM-dependent methyltransferase
MKLHIGCGDVHLEDWVNIDISRESAADRLDNVRFLETVDDWSCDIIYASHVLEHFGRHECMEVLSVWKTKLKSGGILRLAVPNLGEVFQTWMYGKDLSELLGFLYGGQKDPYDYHKMGFDEGSLRRILKEVGFSEVRKWDWRSTEHAHADDYSQSYLPHMQKDSGRLMSLNLEAIK